VPRPVAPVLTRPDSAAAQRRKVREMLPRCKRLSNQTGGAGVAVKDADGRVKLNQLF
jgi:hypothetical protein